MKSEKEIQEKLDYYEAILARMEAGRMVDNPDIFLRVSRHFPREAMEMLNNLTGTEALLCNLPPEDQQWVRQWFSSLTGFAREVLSSRISILRWALERAESEGG
ncbi:hypothetical protein ACFLUF_01970 [Chloroflexota bacterium]